jgi:hypothetical protein
MIPWGGLLANGLWLLGLALLLATWSLPYGEGRRVGGQAKRFWHVNSEAQELRYNKVGGDHAVSEEFVCFGHGTKGCSIRAGNSRR